MPSNYDGVPGNVATSGPLNIASSTVGPPIQITVSGSLPADFLTGVKVNISGHQVNIAANGQYAATVTGASTFTIAQTGTAPGGATGLVQPLNLSTFYSIPSDGDNDNNASIFPSLSVLGDRVQFLAGALGSYKLVTTIVLSSTTDTTAVAYWATATVSLANHDFGWDVVSSPAPWTLGGNVISGDILDVEFHATTSNNWPGLARVNLFHDLAAPGLGFPVAPAAFAGSGQNMGASNEPFCCRGQAIVGGAGTIGIYPSIRVPVTTGTYQLWGDAIAILKIWRPTSMPQ